MSLKPSLFLSHAAKDGDSITLLKNRLTTLTGRSIDIFVSSDGQSIPFGRNWVHEVEEALKRAKLMYVFLSPAALESKWVLFESGYAYSRGIRVVPVGTLGVDLATIGPPLGLLQGFNVSSGPGMNNLVKVINDVFELSFPEILGQEEYHDIFLRNQIQTESILGKLSSLIHEIVFTVNCIHPTGKQAIQKYLDQKGISYVDNGSALNMPGIYLPLGLGLAQIQVDPLLSSTNFIILEELIPFMGGESFKGVFQFKIKIPASSLRAIDEFHKLSARIFGSELRLTPNGAIALDSLHLTLRQRYVNDHIIAAFDPNNSRPSGIEISAYYAASNLREAPVAQALDTLLRVGALFFDSP